jgi:plasmid maintenance system antidote protein VapI
MTEKATSHPGILLRQRFLDPLGISPRQMTTALDVRGRRTSELLTGR